MLGFGAPHSPDAESRAMRAVSSRPFLVEMPQRQLMSFSAGGSRVSTHTAPFPLSPDRCARCRCIESCAVLQICFRCCQFQSARNRRPGGLRTTDTLRVGQRLFAGTSDLDAENRDLLAGEFPRSCATFHPLESTVRVHSATRAGELLVSFCWCRALNAFGSASTTYRLPSRIRFHDRTFRSC